MNIYRNKYRSSINYLIIRDLYVTNLAILKGKGMSLEEIAKTMNTAFLALLDQLIEVEHFITALEKI